MIDLGGENGKLGKNKQNNEGYCELPVNMTRIGYRKYGKEQPLCYNCKGGEGGEREEDVGKKCKGIECNKCCSEQRDNREKYPTLESPDFIFPNDKNERLENKDNFITKGLKILKLF